VTNREADTCIADVLRLYPTHALLKDSTGLCWRVVLFDADGTQPVLVRAEHVVAKMRNVWVPYADVNERAGLAWLDEMDDRLGVDGSPRCCFRDDDGDGNCSIHESPGVLRRHRYEPW